MEASLLRQCPLLLPQNRAKTVYEGFISVQGRDFHLRIELPEDLQMKNARLLCSWQLKTILNGYHQIVQQRMQHSPDLMSFLMELKMVLFIRARMSWGRRRQRERQERENSEQALRCQPGALCGARTQEPRDHDLSRNQELDA
uniref:Fanconi anemia complex subunit FancL WD-repeat containing domain-containing protein n=1 Tax=Felis catus TaxID=9685 RepID=A0ABI7VRW0_FELCA